jgi:hypothetical protein
MPRQTLAIFAHRIRDANHLLNYGHVAVLATLLVFELALKPFLIRHLLRKLSNLFSVGSERGRDQRVASGAEFRLPDMFALCWPISGGRAPHDSILTVINFEGAEFRTLASLFRCIHNKPADETLACSELVFLDLVTKGTRHAVLRELIQAVV